MSKKIIGIVIIIIGFFLLFGIVYILFLNPNFFNKGKEVVENKNINISDKKIKEEPVKSSEKKIKKVQIINNDKSLEDDSDNENENIPVVFKSDKDDLMRMSSSFAERFGSYSNQSDYTNLSHLLIFMSSKMKSRMEKFIRDSRLSKDSSDIYYGITTKTVKAKVLEYNEDVEIARILVNTRRKEALASVENKSNSFSQELIISFIKENGVWKVDSAKWQ